MLGALALSMFGAICLLNPVLFVQFCLGLFVCSACISRMSCSVVRTRPQRFTSILYILTLVVGVRFGEASHPGPRSKVTPRDFCIGCFNPSGLAGKAQVINQYLSHGDLWSIAETHLTTKSVSSFRRGLRVTQSPYRYLITGHPVPVRAHSQTSGGWKGVAALSKHPTRALPVTWDPDISASSRVLVSSTLLHDMWVTMGTLYGESAGTLHPQYLHHNDQLLRAVAMQVCLYSTGLRVVAGDFNLKEHDVAAFQILESAGFRDIQSIACDRWGHQIQNTCKCSTRVDFTKTCILLMCRAPVNGSLHNHLKKLGCVVNS